MTFEVDGKKYDVRVPGTRDLQEAKQVYSVALRKALDDGSMFRDRLDDHLRKQGIWDDEKQKQYIKHVNVLSGGEEKLRNGGIKLSEGKQIALDMRFARLLLQELLSIKQDLDSSTAEGQAENERFNYLIIKCLVYNDSGKQVYNSVDEFLEGGSSEVAINGAIKFSAIYHNIDENFEAELPENKFLLTYELCNEDLHLINKDGKKIDTRGNLVDDDGNVVNESGNKLDEDKVEAKPFLDDDGKPIVLKTEPKLKPKKPRTKK